MRSAATSPPTRSWSAPAPESTCTCAVATTPSTKRAPPVRARGVAGVRSAAGLASNVGVTADGQRDAVFVRGGDNAVYQGSLGTDRRVDPVELPRRLGSATTLCYYSPPATMAAEGARSRPHSASGAACRARRPTSGGRSSNPGRSRNRARASCSVLRGGLDAFGHDRHAEPVGEFDRPRRRWRDSPGRRSRSATKPWSIFTMSIGNRLR